MPPPNGTGVSTNNTRRLGVLNYLVTEGYLVAFNPVAMSRLRAGVVDFTIPIDVVDHIPIMPYPTFDNDIFGLIRPFAPMVRRK